MVDSGGIFKAAKRNRRQAVKRISMEDGLIAEMQSINIVFDSAVSNAENEVNHPIFIAGKEREDPLVSVLEQVHALYKENDSGKKDHYVWLRRNSPVIKALEGQNDFESGN